jgi:hypothetical protein
MGDPAMSESQLGEVGATVLASAVPGPGEPAATPGCPADRYEVKLPSGRIAYVLRKGKGRHIQAAARMAGMNADQMSLSMAMIAVKVLLDGQALTFEDVLELDDADVWPLLGHAMGKGDSSPRST